MYVIETIGVAILVTSVVSLLSMRGRGLCEETETLDIISSLFQHSGLSE